MLLTTKLELNVTFNREIFRQELRQLIDCHIGQSSQFRDYVEIILEMDCERDRLGAEGDNVGGFSLSPEEMEQVERERIGGAEISCVCSQKLGS
jgi:hypothetical protein